MKCFVKNCKSRNDSKVSFHKFPTKPNERKAWLEAIQQTDSKVLNHDTVCSVHFKPSEIVWNTQRIRLARTAIPSLVQCPLNACVDAMEPNEKCTKMSATTNEETTLTSSIVLDYDIVKPVSKRPKFQSHFVFRNACSTNKDNMEHIKKEDSITILIVCESSTTPIENVLIEEDAGITSDDGSESILINDDDDDEDNNYESRTCSNKSPQLPPQPPPPPRDHHGDTTYNLMRIQHAYDFADNLNDVEDTSESIALKQKLKMLKEKYTTQTKTIKSIGQRLRRYEYRLIEQKILLQTLRERNAAVSKYIK